MAIFIPKWENRNNWLGGQSGLNQSLLTGYTPHAYILGSGHGNIGHSLKTPNHIDVDGTAFNGSTSRIEIPSEALGIGGSNSYMLVAQFSLKTLSGIQCLIVRDYSDDGDRVFQFRVDDSTVRFIQFSPSEDVLTITTGGTLKVGQTHTAVAVFDNNQSTSAIYLDGEEVATDAVSTANSDLPLL